MNELDQATDSGPGSTTDVTGPEPARDQRPGSHDGQAQYPRATTATDTDPGYYDGDMHAALAADNTPTRQEAARQDAAGDGQASLGQDTSQGSDAEIDAIVHEDDELPDARTRQQAAADDLADGGPPSGDTARAAREDPADGHDADIGAILHEDDHLPDPRTRQQAAQDDAASNGPAIDTAMATLPEPAHVETAGHETHGQGKPGSQGQSGNGNEYSQISALQADAADRTLGDTTPTGIGLKPTGEQLLEMEDDKRSRVDGLRRELERDEVLDGLHSEAEQDANTVQSILAARPPEGHPVQVVPDTPQLAPVTPAGLDAGMMASSGLMVGVMLVELGRGFHKMLKHRKEVG
jgi:hypothetical protein